MPLRVLCLVTSRTAGNRLRVIQYAVPLREQDVELTVSSFFTEGADEFLYRPGGVLRKTLHVLAGLWRRAGDLYRARTYDLVLVYREALPIGPAIFERALRLLRVPFVYDYDDAIFLGQPNSVNARWSWLRPRSRVATTTALAAAVIVGNEYLAKEARKWNPSVTIIPTPVDTDRHFRRTPHTDRRPMVIGWVGSHSTAPYLRLLDGVLARVAAEHDVVMRVIAGDYEHATCRIEVQPFDLRSEPSEVADFDIGVLPELDDPWTRGKGAFKAMLYMAAGVPVVASRVGVNSAVIPDNVVGFCVDTEDDWFAALTSLLTDAPLRERLGTAGRERAEREYALRVRAPQLAEVLRSAGRRR